MDILEFSTEQGERVFEAIPGDFADGMTFDQREALLTRLQDAIAGAIRDFA